MSIISKIYFSSKKSENLSDLEIDKDVLTVDFSSRGIGHTALLHDELNFILPTDFSKYTEKILVEEEEFQLTQLSSNFIYDCARLTPDDLLKINEKINQHFRNISLKQINKLGIDNLPRYTRIIAGLFFGLVLISYFEFNRPIISILLSIILILMFFLSFRNQKSRQRKFVESESIDFTPQLQELVGICKEAKDKGLFAFYYWSL